MGIQRGYVHERASKGEENTNNVTILTQEGLNLGRGADCGLGTFMADVG